MSAQFEQWIQERAEPAAAMMCDLLDEVLRTAETPYALMITTVNALGRGNLDQKTTLVLHTVLLAYIDATLPRDYAKADFRQRMHTSIQKLAKEGVNALKQSMAARP